MSVIYQPKGRAGEYAAWAANLYLGCSHNCVYCYGADVLRMSRDDFDNHPKPKKNILKRLEQSAKSFKDKGQFMQVLLSFVCDPYQRIDADTGITREAIKILHRHGHTVCILTKGGTRALRDIDLLTKHDAFACTLTTWDVGESLRWEPGAATPHDRLAALSEFHDAGIPTWVSLEPVINPEWTLDLIELTHSYVDKYKVGRMNYISKLPEEYRDEMQGIDWAKFGRDAERLLQKLGRDHYIKDDLRSVM